MDQTPPSTSTLARLAITVHGVVQGVGFRPFVYNAAVARRLTGWVRNEADTVEIEIQGDRSDLDAFVQTLRNSPPPQARLDAVDIRSVMPEADGTAFEIRPSQGQASPRPTIPADLATCDDCLAEIHASGQRRKGYAFTNCTNCGPRWSIIRGVPYDRPKTSMAPFTMCPDCQAEYDDPTDRRFHAQPIACARCGPELRLLDASGNDLAVGDDAMAECARAILAGQIVAIKGLGGFQLVVDATNSEAVAALRRRKHRPSKPFALLIDSLDTVRRYCHVSEEETQALTSVSAPIVLLRRRAVESDIAPEVAPGNPTLGVMLPYTPLHHLLIEAIGRPVVCTSGNLSEEPMATSTQDALERLGTIADVLLTHNRPIVRPVDDSVGQVTAAGFQLLRRARGYAPLPNELSDDGSIILAVGGHLKNAVALALGNQVVVGSHVGDLETVASLEVHRRAVRDLVEFFAVTPDVIACDLHPDYGSTRHAETLADQWGVPLVRLQHHHAHVAACMAEHGLEGPVLGLSWDGTGYGPDGTVWGGEALLCESGRFTRVAHLRTFPLPGGDRAVREPRRSALGLLFEHRTTNPQSP
ncbi:MAG: carbamoyltransferase HypF, partial [Pirellulales bacterium]|nr:carbamoyltransferase HypF [Pirellulales bacterium]